jgi:hypothetical protein
MRKLSRLAPIACVGFPSGRPVTARGESIVRLRNIRCIGS